MKKITLGLLIRTMTRFFQPQITLMGADFFATNCADYTD